MDRKHVQMDQIYQSHQLPTHLDTYMWRRATSQAPKRQARRGSQLVLMNLLTFLFQHLSSDLEYFYLEAAGLQKDRRGL